MDYQIVTKPRILCLHGHRSSGKILENQLEIWPEYVREKMDLLFVDAPFLWKENRVPRRSMILPIMNGSTPTRSDCPISDYSEYWNFDECIAYIDDCMTRIGPFDGLLGVSQGALLSAALPGMQAEGVALTGVPKIKFVIIISGAKFGGSKFSSPELAKNAFSSPIECPSLHFLGEKDRAKPDGIELLDSFVEPTVLYHHEGHGVPKLDEEALEVLLGFLQKIKKLL